MADFEGRKNSTKVRCHSGYTYAERPDSFTWEGQTQWVERIEKEWKEPGEKHFYVRTEDARRFHICYHELEGQWTVEGLKGQKWMIF